MRNLIAIAIKELRSYFCSPLAYCMLVICLGIFNLFFFVIIDQSREAVLYDVFKIMEFMFLFFVPLMTMRAFAYEKENGTMEFLLTTPTTPAAIVLGKYIGTVLFFAILIALTGSYYGIIEFFGSPQRVMTFAGYLGVFVECAMFVSVGLVVSVFSASQIVAAISTYVILFVLYFSSTVSMYVTGRAAKIFTYISTLNHAERFFSGLITLEDCIYYASIIGGSLFFVWVGIQRGQSRFSLRRAGAIVLVVGVAVGGNFLGHRSQARVDLTQTRQHTIRPMTASVIGNLKTSVTITVLYVGIPPRYLEDLLREYRRAGNGMVTTEIVDPLVQLGYAAQFGNIIRGRESRVVVQSGAERRDVDFTDKPLTEEQLTNAIIRATRRRVIAYFVTGHLENAWNDEKEAGLSKYTTLLEVNNIESRELLLAADGGIPADCDVLVIAGARKPFTEKETRIVQEYLAAGGDALILVENVLVSTPQKKLTAEELALNPSMNEILVPWGMRVADDVVVDLSSHASGDVGSPATRNYMTHRAIVKDLDYTFYVRPRSISIAQARRDTVKLAPLVLTSSAQNSWGETDRYLVVKYDEGVDRPGPVPIAFVAWEPKTAAKRSDSRLVVFTDADFLTNAFVAQYSNAQMGINIIKWLSEIDYEVFAQSSDITVVKLDLTSAQKRAVVGVLFFMPVAILLIGVWVWWRRK